MVMLSSGRDSFPPKPLVPEGSHPAGCFAVVYLGTHKVSYKGVESYKRLIQMGFELLDENDDKGKPRQVWTDRLTASLHEKAKLRKYIDRWLPAPLTETEAQKFSTDSLLGKSATLVYLHEPGKKDSSKTYSNIIAIKQGSHVYKATAPIINYDVSHHDPMQFNKLPKWLQLRVSESQEYSKLADVDMGQPTRNAGELGMPQAPIPDSNELDDDIPF